MTKRPTVSKLKKKLDAIFSKYIRHKYAKDGMVTCYTCGHTNEIKKMQNGHFIPRQYLRTRFDERNCRPQCYACNVLYGGQSSAFALKLQEEYGDDIIKELEKDRMTPIKLDVPWYQEKIKEYTEKLNLF